LACEHALRIPKFEKQASSSSPAERFTLSATRLPATQRLPALGFAPRPCDRFALVEDEETTGLARTQEFFRAESSSNVDPVEKAPAFRRLSGRLQRPTFLAVPLQ